MNTATALEVGTRVLYVGGGDEHNESLVGRFGTITSADNSSLPYYVQFETHPADTWWCAAEAVVAVPKIGDKVIPLPNDEGDWLGIPEDYRTAVSTVADVRYLSGKIVQIVAEFQSRQKPDDTLRWYFHNWKPADGHTLTVSEPVEETVPKHELDRANERVEELRNRASKWERDFNRYAERIMQEAVDRDWCSEYERVMDDIRGDLEIATLPDREQEVDIEWEETYTVTVKRSATVTLNAGYDESDVERAARDANSNCDASREEILQAVRDGDYESCDFVDDSAEVA